LWFRQTCRTWRAASIGPETGWKPGRCYSNVAHGAITLTGMSAHYRPANIRNGDLFLDIRHVKRILDKDVLVQRGALKSFSS
jgi:hypothetical protein